MLSPFVYLFYKQLPFSKCFHQSASTNNNTMSIITYVQYEKTLCRSFIFGWKELKNLRRGSGEPVGLTN